MREHVTPTPRTPREIVFEHALILRRLSGQMRSVLREPETIPMPATLRRSLTDSARAFEECAGDLEALAATASHTLVRVPTWRDGVKAALGFLVPCAAFLAIVALVVSSVPQAPTDPKEIQRYLDDAKWIQMYEDRLEATSRGEHGPR
ncbi:hypothetical protein [Novosphingobium sp. ST904]|uniref:hypothetical protein n=1 Tax=Novosphingobium sp. ST904 TaxID=1684385 RepID=UPI0006CCD246|nr:hypothetical protein [Novosphingobium sp. ST904]KPH63553.1 hypothetical protein ADT71_12960 [Novosphingobium sp. ST904]TCM32392.1 hypothetical protein EDF59_12487 [Novosphingobium sp. ST904]